MLRGELKEALDKIAFDIKRIVQFMMESDKGINQKINENTLIDSHIYEELDVTQDDIGLYTLFINDYVQYIESANLTHNLDVVMSVIKFMYENSLYAEINIKSDYCQKCGYDGEIKIIDVDGKLDWECPQCGNRDHKLMNVSRRTCGYIGTNFWSQSRTEDIHDRYVHLDDHTC
jgi:ribonucleoside-triphosphate reductase